MKTFLKNIALVFMHDFSTNIHPCKCMRKKRAYLRTTDEQKKAIVALRKQGRTFHEIAQYLNLREAHVYQTYKRIEPTLEKETPHAS